MRLLKSAGFLRISILALVMVSAGSLNAQPSTDSRTPTTTDREITTDRRTVVERDHDSDWGWIGLLGLLGLAGLSPRRRIVEHDRGDTGHRPPNR
jgi:MYXO-CTERM domain-containing protein